MIFPASSVLDTFNRADGAVGAPWTANPDGGVRSQFNVSGNQCVPAGAGGWMYWDDFYDGDSENFVTVVNYAGGTVEIDRTYGTGTVDWGGYGFVWNPTAGEFRINKYATGGAEIPLTGAAGSLSSGDSLGFRIVRNGLFGFHKSGGEWSQVIGFIDPGFTGGGKPSLYTASAATVFDDWGGGLIATAGDMTLLGVG